MRSLGATIRSLRTRAGLSQEGLARLVGLSQGQVSRLERGASEVVRPKILVQLASVLGVSPSTLLPDATPWRAAKSSGADPAGTFRVGYWESVWSAPVIAVAEGDLTSARLSSRGRIGSLFTAIAPDLQRDPTSRPLPPAELIRALRSAYYAAIVVPGDAMADHPEELIECAQVALVLDGVQVAVCMPGEHAHANGIDSGQSRSAAAWEHVRRASIEAPITVYFPTGVGSVGLVHRLRDLLNGSVEASGVRPEKWPGFWDEAEPRLPAGRPVIAVAPEPYMDAWRRLVWESASGRTTIPVTHQEMWPDAPPTVSALSLIFHRDRCDSWLSNRVVYDFLDAVEHQAQEIDRRSPRVLELLADRLQLDVPTIIRECARCDFTTRFAPSWVAMLRAHSRASAG